MISSPRCGIFQSLYSWFLSFLPQWFMIHEDFLITYWFNDFLRDNLVSFCILWCSNFCFIQAWYHHSFCLRMAFFCNWTLSTRLLEKQAGCQPRMHELYRRGWKLDSRKRHILHSLDRTQLIHTCILLSFSQSLVIPNYQVFKTKIHDSYMFCYDDSWFRFHPENKFVKWKNGSQSKLTFVY